MVPLRRVSTGEQVDGTGLQRQSDAFAAYANSRGWTLHPETYSDEGVSGFSGANLDGDLGRFLRDHKAGRFGSTPIALGIEDLDRLSRQFTLAFLPILVDDLLNAGVTLSVISKGRDFSRASIRSNPMEIHELLFWMGGAHEFSAKLSHRIGKHRDSIRASIRDGKPANPGTAPSWISLQDDTWQLNSYAAVVRRVIVMAQEGLGAHQIARTLNAEGIPSPGTVKALQRDRAATPKPWDKNSALQLLKSPAIHGGRAIATPGHNARIREWKEDCAHKVRQDVSPDALPKRPQRTFEKEQENYYPALISPSEHRALLRLLTERKTIAATGRVDQYRWIGQRLTVCVCGARATAYSTTSRGKTFRYLRCTGRGRGDGCSAAMVPLAAAQAHVLTRLASDDFLLMLDRQRDGSSETRKGQLLSEREALQRDLQQQQQQAEAGEQAMAAATDAVVLGILAKRQAQLQEQLQQATDRLEAVEHELQQLNRGSDSEPIGSAAQAAIRELLERFATEADEASDRRLVNDHLRRLGVRITVDANGERCGLQVGDGAMAWQTLTPRLDLAALKAGVTEAIEVPVDLTEENLRLLQEHGGIMDLGAAMEKAGITGGRGVLGT